MPRLREIPTKLGVADAVLPLPLFPITWRHLKILGFFGLWAAWAWMSLPDDTAPFGAGAIMLVALVFCPVIAPAPQAPMSSGSRAKAVLRWAGAW